jgi:cephalosporin hydroxylase
MGAAGIEPGATISCGMLEQARWDGSTLHLGDVEFEVRGKYKWDEWDHRHGRFLLMRPRGLIERYARFWSTRTRPRNVVELGIWEGGSAVFWFEAFAPEKYVAIDRLVRADSDHFNSYVKSRDVADRLKTYWGVDQGDRETLSAIVEREFDGPIDLVIDDASHHYEPTQASFEVLFPRLRPGRLYIIEDWQWSYAPPESWPKSWKNVEPVSRLVRELLDVVGTPRRLRSPLHKSVEGLTVFGPFVAIEKSGQSPALE